MAKALLGHMGGTDPRLTRDATLLRRRVADLEALVSRLQIENDELSTAVRERDALLRSDLGPELAPESPEGLLEPALR